AISGMVSMTVFHVVVSLGLVSMTSTASDSSSATYRRVWAAFSVILLGWPFTGMRVITAGVFPFRFTTSISRSRRLETYAHVVLMLCAGSGVGCAIATQNGY